MEREERKKKKKPASKSRHSIGLAIDPFGFPAVMISFDVSTIFRLAIPRN